MLARQEELSKDLEMKQQEVENLRGLTCQLEAEKVKLEARLEETEQYRLEVAKESNQHMEETSEKIRDLKTQFEEKQEESNLLVEERDRTVAELVKCREQLTALQYRPSTATSRARWRSCRGR